MNNNKVALITGASSGIGHAFALYLAKAGYDLVLIARSKVDLERVATACRLQGCVNVYAIAKDLTEKNAAIDIFKILAEKNIEIHLLINNAGFGIWGQFYSSDIALEEKMIQLHLTNMIEMTKLSLPALIKTQGYVLNIGSVYSFTPVPFQSIYAASKAFLLSFSLSLREELKNKGVSVSVLCPGSTKTQFHKKADLGKSKRFQSLPSDVVQIAYQGLMAKKAIIIPGFINKLFVIASRLIPFSILCRFVSWAVYSVRKLEIEKTNENN